MQKKLDSTRLYNVIIFILILSSRAYSILWIRLCHKKAGPLDTFLNKLCSRFTHSHSSHVTIWANRGRSGGGHYQHCGRVSKFWRGLGSIGSRKSFRILQSTQLQRGLVFAIQSASRKDPIGASGCRAKTGKYYVFDHEPRSNRGLKNCSVVVIVVQFQYFLNWWCNILIFNRYAM